MPVEQRRREIFAAAETLFGQHGYASVTMADIAAVRTYLRLRFPRLP